MNSTLRGRITMELATPDGLGRRIQVGLAFHQAAPWAVELTFPLPDDEPVSWTVSRELLLDGLSTVAGEGDVRIQPVEAHDRDLVAISLRSPEGGAELTAPLTALHAYLLRTDMMIPFGEEFSDAWLDQGITGLLAEAELHRCLDPDGPGDQGR